MHVSLSILHVIILLALHPSLAPTLQPYKVKVRITNTAYCCAVAGYTYTVCMCRDQARAAISLLLCKREKSPREHSAMQLPDLCSRNRDCLTGKVDEKDRRENKEPKHERNDSEKSEVRPES